MTLLNAPCPRCAFPKMLARTGSYEYQYAGEFVRVEDIEFSACHRCGAECILAEQHQRNGERITNANLEALAAKWAETRTVVLSADAMARASSLPPGLRGAELGVNDPRYPQPQRAYG